VGKINMVRVLIGGLAAGVVLNISETILNTVVLGADMAAELAKMGLPAIGGSAIGVFVTLCFLLGIAIVWLYAAMRPRFGPGPKTAAITGVAVWFLAYLYGGIGLMVMGFVSSHTAMISLPWGFVEVMIAAQVGAYLYKE
jgi:hypothetical protein